MSIDMSIEGPASIVSMDSRPRMSSSGPTLQYSNDGAAFKMEHSKDFALKTFWKDEGEVILFIGPYLRQPVWLFSL